MIQINMFTIIFESILPASLKFFSKTLTFIFKFEFEKNFLTATNKPR